MRLFLPHRRHALHHLQQVYFPKTCSDINPKTPNDFCCCLIQTQAWNMNENIQLTGMCKIKRTNSTASDTKMHREKTQKLYGLLYFITCNRSALEEQQVERFVSIKAVKFWLLRSFIGALQEYENVQITLVCVRQPEGSEDKTSGEENSYILLLAGRGRLFSTKSNQTTEKSHQKPPNLWSNLTGSPYFPNILYSGPNFFVECFNWEKKCLMKMKTQLFRATSWRQLLKGPVSTQ